MHDPERSGGDALQCWLRAQLQVRCALAADGPSCVQTYLHWGAEVERQAGPPAFKVQLRILRTLLQTAQDEALPRSWRSTCLDHAHLPLLQLAASIGLHDPVAMQALEAAVQCSRDRLRQGRALPRPGLSSH